MDDRADQFSLAAVAWELLAGRPAFLADDDGALLWQILNDQPPPLGRFVDLPPAQLAEVEAVLRAGLSKDRNERYPDILEFARALDGVLVSASGELPQLRRAPVSSPSLTALPVVSPPLDEFAGVGQSYSGSRLAPVTAGAGDPMLELAACALSPPSPSTSPAA